MTNTIWTATCSAIVVGTALGALAQTPAGQPNSSTPADQRVTVTGCLKAAPSATAPTDTTGATAGTAGTTGAGATGAATDSADAKFVLENATISAAKADAASEPAAASPNPTPSAAAPNSAESGKTYRLVANAAALSPHVGKKLELTGTLIQDSASSSAPQGAAGPALRVEAGKVIAASCEK